MGRKGNLLPSERLPLKVSPALLDYLRSAVSTGLYGKNLQDAADRLISQGIDRLIDQGKIGPIKHFVLQDVEEPNN